MKKPTFFTGLLFGVLIGLLIWYWQKSTSAEDGALALLDRMAELDAQRRTAKTASVPPTTAVVAPTDTELPSFLANRAAEAATSAVAAEDLTAIHGVGPVFAGRLQAAGITTIAAVGTTAVARLADILQISEGRAAAIQQAAQTG